MLATTLLETPAQFRQLEKAKGSMHQWANARQRLPDSDAVND
jgi:hypothetical protein